MINRIERNLLLVSAIACWTSGCASAQQYPVRPIRLIIPASAGMQPDINGRLVASELVKQLGQQVVVDNRPGANSIIGFELLARAAPDGYTIGVAPFQLIVNPFAYAKLPYDAVKDFQPVIRAGTTPNLLAVTPGLPVHSVKNLIAHARRNPDKLTFGGAGKGSSMHLSFELFKSMTGIRIYHVFYKDTMQAITEVIGGQIHMMFANIGPLLQHAKSGKVRALGVTSLERLPMLPNVPTIAESGLAGFETAASGGYIVPARVSRDIVLRLNAEINKVLQVPDVRNKIEAMGGIVGGGTPEQYAEHIRKESEKWGKVFKIAGITPQ